MLSPVVDAVRHAFAGASWLDVVRRTEAIPALDAKVLLHAGPPLDGSPPLLLRNAAAQALLFEGQAACVADALTMIDRQAVVLLPAQDHGVVTPLAQIVSSSMPLAAVGDASCRVHAPLIEGAPPALRFGALSSESVRRLTELSVFAQETLRGALASAPVALSPIICAALDAGDECHSRTDGAHQSLLAALPLSHEASSYLGGLRGFSLPILMAASGWALRRHAGGDAHAIVAAGGNGVHFGIRLAGSDRWHTTEARPPKGVLFDVSDGVDVMAAIGDSAVVDFCGLGGQALAASPTLIEEWQALLPADALPHRNDVVNAATGIVDARRVCAGRQAPWVNLAMLDAAGVRGLLGRGFYEPPVDLFVDALAGIQPCVREPLRECLL